VTNDWLTADFNEHRARLHAIAYRLTGSNADAEDAVQKAWIRLNRREASELDNVPGWLTTVVARISRDILRKRAARREAPGGEAEIRRLPTAERHVDLGLVDSVGTALMVVLDCLSPPERRPRRRSSPSTSTAVSTAGSRGRSPSRSAGRRRHSGRRSSRCWSGAPRQRRSQLVGEDSCEPLLVALRCPTTVDDEQPVDLGGHERMDEVGRVALS
jgi:hypothetical protein